MVTVLLALVLAILARAEGLRRGVAAISSRLAAAPSGAFAVTVALLGAGLATAVLRLLYRGLLTNVDEMASTVHARYLANGLLAGPTHGLPEFWLIPNTLVVSEGWVSQYPPTHLVAMAGAERLGAPLLLGPVCFGLTVGLLALALPRLLPERRGVSRFAPLLAALSPLLLFLAGGTLNHVTTGALLACALYGALRARDGSAWWSMGAGLAVGLAVADRPLIALVLGSVFTIGLWVPTVAERERGARWLLARGLGTVAGGAPVALLLGAYNSRLFGAPTTLGYSAAFGARHGLGFHQDPWGYSYGLREALGFTSVDVVSLGIQLLETPYPLTVLIAVYLLVGKHLPRGTGVLAAWAFLPLLANGLYWFHTTRMLYEAAPAWLALATLGAAELAGGHGATTRGGSPRRSLAHDAWAWALVIGAVGSIAWGAPDRWRSYRWNPESLDRITLPVPPDGRAALVFVHTSWSERTSSLLQGAGGMRQDSVITVLRRNASCDLHLYAAAREQALRHERPTALPPVDLDQVAGTHPDLQVVALPGGTVRVRRGQPVPAACARELAADRFGAVALAPLLWQGDLPGIEDGRPLFVRDYGPERNRAILDLYPDRAAFAYTPMALDGPPRLVPYERGMEALWGGSPADPAAGDSPRS